MEDTASGIDEALLGKLAVMARHGTSVRRRGEVAEIVPVKRPQKTLLLSRHDLARALHKGWIVPAGPEGLQLTKRGLMLVRRVRSLLRPAAAPSDPSHPFASGAVRSRPNINRDESPLAWLRRRTDKRGRPLISAAEYDAGERLRTDFWLAHMTPRVTASWSRTAPAARRRRGPPANCDVLDHVVAARQRVRRALAAVGPELAGVLIDVCCHLQGLEQVERTAGWPQRAGKVVLQIALQRLARHYGIAAPTAGRIRHWGAPDYRPSLQIADTGEDGEPDPSLSGGG
ncbi:MAG TPA: DUF6456 domain-containing protein [Hyphomicrobiaceae bacterium]|nr:DUF6456 domain-containing protein [Hyphomicrobiaceae bacterium]